MLLHFKSALSILSKGAAICGRSKVAAFCRPLHLSPYISGCNLVAKHSKLSNSNIPLLIIRRLVHYDMKLYTDRGNIFSLKLYAAASLSGTPLDVKIVNKESFKLKDCFKKVQLPVLEIEAGRYIHSVNSACRYLFEQKKDGQTADMKAKVDELMEWDSSTLQVVFEVNVVY